MLVIIEAFRNCFKVEMTLMALEKERYNDLCFLFSSMNHCMYVCALSIFFLTIKKKSVLTSASNYQYHNLAPKQKLLVFPLGGHLVCREVPMMCH